MPEDLKGSHKGGCRFFTTEWSLVLAAGDSEDPDSREALTALCEAYWYPVYIHVRHLGHDAEEARDLTQGYFADLLDRRFIKVASPDRGRFRAFLKTTVQRYLSHEHRRSQAQKRGGGQVRITLDFQDAESKFSREIASSKTPDKLFEEHWARSLLERALERLRSELQHSTGSDRFRRLETFLTDASPGARYKQVAAELGTTESAVKSTVHRMRHRYGELLRAEVGRTVSRPEEVDEEIRYLFSVLGS